MSNSPKDLKKYRSRCQEGAADKAVCMAFAYWKHQREGTMWELKSLEIRNLELTRWLRFKSSYENSSCLSGVLQSKILHVNQWLEYYSSIGVHQLVCKSLCQNSFFFRRQTKSHASQVQYSRYLSRKIGRILLARYVGFVELQSNFVQHSGVEGPGEKARP